MKHPFNKLTRNDVQSLRRKPDGIPTGESEITYKFTLQNITDAVKHLETIYAGRVRRTFAEKLLIRNEIY